MVRKRIQLAQNFFRDRSLVASIVAASTITKEDVVYEIGPGEGIITGELAERAGKVVAIEKDVALAARLRNRFRDKENVKIHDGDFLRYKINEKKYKIFSNIPFNITAEVVKRVLFGETPQAKPISYCKRKPQVNSLEVQSRQKYQYSPSLGSSSEFYVNSKGLTLSRFQTLMLFFFSSQGANKR